MNDLWNYRDDGPVPKLAPGARNRLGLPPTLLAVDDPRAFQAPVFDPALKQHQNAYRAADPRFTDPELSAAWYAARHHAMDLLLAAVAASPWAESVVLRGSVVLRAWFGDAARQPGDLDFVVVPQDWRIEEPRTGDLLYGIAAAAEAASDDRVRFRAADAVDEDIWTYERVPGRRLMLPWTADGLPGGAVQLDFVFNEPLPVAPEPVEVTPGSHLPAATRELSLAWKLQWLVTDCYPQGKDLYDAVLLAESAPLRYEVLRDVMAECAEPHYAEHPVDPAAIRSLQLLVSGDWRHFAREYPHLAADPVALVGRLAAALAPTFAEVPEADRPTWWREGWLARLRTRHAEGGLDAVAEQLSRAPFGLAYRLAREVVDPADLDDDALAEAILAAPANAYWAERVREGAYTLRQLLAIG